MFKAKKKIFKLIVQFINYIDNTYVLQSLNYNKSVKHFYVIGTTY